MNNVSDETCTISNLNDENQCARIVLCLTLVIERPQIGLDISCYNDSDGMCTDWNISKFSDGVCTDRFMSKFSDGMCTDRICLTLVMECSKIGLCLTLEMECAQIG